MHNKCAIICDLKQSRKIRDWNRAVESMKNTISRINQHLGDQIYIDFESTIGDEFQGALNDIVLSYYVYLNIRETLPYDFYCGIGVGDIENPNNNNEWMRGNAFYRARDALDHCKKHHKRIYFLSSENDCLFDSNINSLLSLLDINYNSWTQNQKNIIWY